MNAPAGITTALGVFVGYVMLDAWVANQDRHHQIWAAIQDGGALYLSRLPTTTALRSRGIWAMKNAKTRLQTRDKKQGRSAFRGPRARSGFFQTIKRIIKTLPTLDVFQHFAKLEPRAAQIWLAKLQGNIGFDVVDAILAEVPPQRMSPITIQFTSALLCINQRRLLA